MNFVKRERTSRDKRKPFLESTSFEPSLLFGDALEQSASMNILETRRSEMAEDLYPWDSAYLNVGHTSRQDPREDRLTLPDYVIRTKCPRH